MLAYDFSFYWSYSLTKINGYGTCSVSMIYGYGAK